MKREPYVDFLAERDNLLRRLEWARIHTRHTRLCGYQILGNEGWEPFTHETARKLLQEREGPSQLDLANARMRPGWGAK